MRTQESSRELKGTQGISSELIELKGTQGNSSELIWTCKTWGNLKEALVEVVGGKKLRKRGKEDKFHKREKNNKKRANIEALYERLKRVTSSASQILG